MLFIGFGVFAQQQKPLIQFSGVIYDLDSNTVVPYVTLRNQTAKKSYSANYKGYFSFVAQEGDSVHFTSIGYKKIDLVIPTNLRDKKFTVVIKMQSDNIELPMVRVFPWASVDEFKKEFLTLKFADDDFEIARKNVSRESLAGLAANLPRDGRENVGSVFNNNHIGLTNKNMVQVNPLMNPFAWAALIKQITDGKKNKKKD